MGDGTRLHDNPDHWSDIVGMPDEWDLKNLRTLVNNFYKEKFEFTLEDETTMRLTGLQWTKEEVKDAKRQHQQESNPLNEFGVKSKETEMRIGTAIPNVLWARISDAYPTMFKDKKHYDWFVKNFPEFRVAQRY